MKWLRFTGVLGLQPLPLHSYECPASSLDLLTCGNITFLLPCHSGRGISLRSCVILKSFIHYMHVFYNNIRESKPMSTAELPLCRTCHRGRFPELPAYIQRIRDLQSPDQLQGAAERLSFWVAGLMQAVHRFDRLSLLEMTSTKERLELLTSRLNAVAAGLGEGNLRACRIM